MSTQIAAQPLASTHHHDFKDIPIDVFIRFVLPAMPRSYWVLLQRLSRALRLAGQQLMSSSPVIDLINMPVNEDYYNSIEPFKFVLRMLRQHDGVVAQVADPRLQKNPMRLDQSPQRSSQRDKKNRVTEIVSDYEFAWISHHVTYVVNDTGDRCEDSRKVLFAAPSFVSPNITQLRLPPCIEIDLPKLDILFAILPNLESITFTRSDLFFTFDLLADGEGIAPDVSHSKLQEIVAVSCDFVNSKQYNSCSWMLRNLLQVKNEYTDQTKLFPSLNKVKFVGCVNGTNDDIFRASNQEENRPCNVHTWDATYRAWAYQMTPGASITVEVMFEISRDNKNHWPCLQDAVMDSRCATYLLQNIGILPQTIYFVQKYDTKRAMTLVDMVCSPYSKITEEELDTFLLENQGLVDLSQLLATWIISIESNNHEHVAMLTRLARKYDDGKLFAPRQFEKVLLWLHDLKRAQQEYEQRLVSFLHAMDQNGWNMHHADYVKVALQNQQVLEALIQMDRQKGLLDTSLLDHKERDERFRELLLLAVQTKSYFAIPLVLNIAGDEYVNVVLEKDIGTLVSHALSNAVPFGYVAYLLFKNPLGIQTEDGSTLLHLAAKYATEIDCVTAIVKLVPGTLDINAVDNQGNTALHLLCSNGKVTAATLAAQKGANPNIKNNDGKYPADLLKEYFRTHDDPKNFVQFLRVPPELTYDLERV